VAVPSLIIVLSTPAPLIVIPAGMINLAVQTQVPAGTNTVSPTVAALTAAWTASKSHDAATWTSP
jgi:hypothetical protein